jgi:trehalose synthase-fused probable maltokinase
VTTSAREALGQARWASLFGPAWRGRLAAALLEYATPRRWFRGKARLPTGATVRDLVALDGRGARGDRDRDPGGAGAASGEAGSDAVLADAVLAILEIAYDVGAPEQYVLALARADGAQVARLERERPHALIAHLPLEGAALVDGLATGEVGPALLHILGAGVEVRGAAGGLLRGQSSALLARMAPGVAGGAGQDDPGGRRAVAPEVEQTNSILVFGTEVLLKVYRQVTPGPNPELEVGAFLTALDRHPPIAPRVLGALFYVPEDDLDGHAPGSGPGLSLGIAHEFLANDGDAWSFVLGALTQELARAPTTVTATARSGSRPLADVPALAPHWQALAEALGRRTGGLHLALASGGADAPDFAPEPFSEEDRRTLAARALAMLEEQLRTLAALRERLPTATAALAARLGAPEVHAAALDLTSAFAREPLSGSKIRLHGDLHLGQVLMRGSDVTIIDFEGEPARPLAERRAKGSPFRDVMAMVRSFDYAAEAAVRQTMLAVGEATEAASRAAADRWRLAIGAVYVGAYLRAVGDAPFLPSSPPSPSSSSVPAASAPGASDALGLVRAFFALEKVIYEIRYELNHRPDWVAIPLRGLAAIVGLDAGGGA